MRNTRLLPRKFLLVLAFTAVAACTVFSPGQASQVNLDVSLDNHYIEAGRGDERHLQVLVEAPAGGEGEPVRQRLNVALVIDRSGSMASENKLEYVKEAALGVVDSLREGDCFSLIIFDSRVKVLLRAQQMGDRHYARRLITNLHPGMNTNLAGGLMEGYRQVRKHAGLYSINRVILLTDGLANVGLTDPERLSLVALDESELGVSLSTFGVGLDFNEDLVSALAESGRGNYYYIDDPGRIPEMMAREFRLTSETVALDLSLTIELNRDIEMGDLLGYGFHRDGNRVSVRVGDLAAGERRRFIIRFRAPGMSPGRHRAGTVRMSYILPGRSSRSSVAKELDVWCVRDRAEVHSHRDGKVTERVAIYEAHEARKKAAEAFDRGNTGEAELILKKAQERIDSLGAESDRVVEEVARTRNYGNVIVSPIDERERSRIQKEIKYDADMNYAD